MTDIVKRSAGTPLDLGVERDGELIHLTATPENGKGIKVGGQPLANRGYLGVEHQTRHDAGRAAGRPGGSPVNTCGR